MKIAFENRKQNFSEDLQPDLNSTYFLNSSACIYALYVVKV